MENTDQTCVIYNGSCPICSREVDVYKDVSTRAGLDIAYHDLGETDLDRFGLTPDAAAREFHVLKAGTLYKGLPAFVQLWSDLPRWRWLARAVQIPVIWQLANLAYRFIAAPALYAMHKRRQRRAAQA
ncbi:thiol-disulfide oxidoreductase DCC family protein [Algirhabdus cladophorae]|uniref:thiol-disulfide oxidoreductase DCC family protein n=1 Tax=Algirhabdus cladophorae TaxID=3377108 RepID=UPI003B8492E2